MTAILQLRGFGVAFGENMVLRSVDLEVNTGVTTLMGPGGAGKSTLVRTIAGQNDAQPLLRTWGIARYLGGALEDSRRPFLLAQSARLMIASVLENVSIGLAARHTLTQRQQRGVVESVLRGLNLPSLAERREDIPLLAGHFLNELALRYKKDVTGLSPEAVEQLVAAAWPGNVRQLYNVIEQSVALTTTSRIPANLVQQAIQREQTELASFEQARRKFERDYLAQLLKITDGNVTQAARLAKRNRTEFYKLLQRHQLDPRLFKPQRA